MIVILNYAQYQYLKENGIFEKYKNIISSRYNFDVLDFSEDSKFLLRSFPWSSTPEGHDFWKKYEEGSMDLHHSDTYTFKTK